MKKSRHTRNPLLTAPTALALMLAAILSSCAVDRPYEALLKENVQSKSVIDTEAEYLYVPSTQESTRTSSASRPHWMGEAKRVRLRFAEKSLDIVEVESDARFAGNTTNEKLVLSIPVDHVDYQCAENSVGECSNKEEENSRITWREKTRFKADFGGMRVAEVNTLPIQIANLFSMGRCYDEGESRLLSAKVESDAINIQVERFFSANLSCADGLESLSDLSFSVVHHYSLAKLTSLASRDYKPVTYPEADQRRFGFFTTEVRQLSNDNRDRATNSQTFMNRWNPERREVVYHLSDAFAKPENAVVRQATYDSVASINDGLAKAGAKLRLKLEEPSGKISGDIRNSMIVMVEDPPALGLLGYGPTVADPRTGEILSGRVVMYLGIVKKTIRATYEEIRKQRQSAGVATEGTGTPGTAPGDGGETGRRAVDRAVENLRTLAPAGKIAHAPARTNAKKPSKNVENRIIPSMSLTQIRASVKDYARNVKTENTLEKRLEAASRSCLYLAEQVSIEESVLKAIEGKLGAQELKPWEALSDAEREQLLTVLVPYVWKPILVHELGHNLGLRHNFAGSEDEENFYTAEELKELGIEHKVPFSTVMEYAPRTVNELHVMGKYDIAALRFGYGRQVEKKDGTLLQLEASLAETEKSAQNLELKAFQFCTDENVGVNAGCKRFDEGTSYAEIARFLISNYEERYAWRNFRNGARNFSIYDDEAYAEAVDDTFSHLRIFLEVRERINHLYPWLTVEEWGQNPFLKDLDEAVALSAAFFQKVVAMPDLTCVLNRKAEDGTSRTVLAPLADLSTDLISCFDPAVAGMLNASYEVVGEFGKSFQSRKHQNNPNAYADQIDVRGIWVDKLLAANTLFARKVGVSSMDEVSDNFLSYKNTDAELRELFTGVLFNRLEREVAIRFIDGTSETMVLPYSLPLESGQLIHRKTGGIRKMLRLPEEDTLLARELTRIAGRELPHIQYGRENASFLEPFSVLSTIPNGRNAADFREVALGADRYYASANNTVAARVIAELNTVRTLSQLTPEQRQQTTGPHMTIDAELTRRFDAGDLESEEHYALLLEKILLRR